MNGRAPVMGADETIKSVEGMMNGLWLTQLV